VHEPARDRTRRRAAVAVDAVPDDAQLAQRPDQRPRELGAFPVAVDGPQHVLVDELPDPLQVVELLRRQVVGEVEVVGAQ
jgi:hypothetical protein